VCGEGSDRTWVGRETNPAPHAAEGSVKGFGRFGVGSVSEGFNGKDNSGQRWEAIVQSDGEKNGKGRL
jgi:hypothetical protein